MDPMDTGLLEIRYYGSYVVDLYNATGHIERRPHAARPTRPPVALATEWGDARVQRRDRLDGVVHEYVLAA
jgi:hypothetical protein